MAVAIVNQDVTHANGNSFTAGAGSNRLLVFAGASVDTNQMPTGGSGTFGGTALLEAVDVAWDGGVRKGIVRGYYLPEASIPAGAQVSAFTANTTLETPYEGSVLTLSGVDQTMPIPATGIATITLDDVADTLNFAAPAGIAFLVSQHLGATMSDPAGWTLLSTYAPMTNGTQLKTWQRAFATADPAASVTLTGGGAIDGRASVFCVAEAAGGGGVALDGSIAVDSAITASLNQAQGIAATVAGDSAITASLQQTQGIAAAVQGASVLSADARLAMLLDAPVMSGAAISGDMGLELGLGAAVNSLSVLQASAAIDMLLSGDMAGLSALSAELSIQGQIALAASINAQSALAAALSQQQPLNASIPANSTVQATLRMSQRLSAGIASASDIVTLLRLAVGMDVDISTASQISALLSGVTDVEPGFLIADAVRVRDALTATVMVRDALTGTVRVRDALTATVRIKPGAN